MGAPGRRTDAAKSAARMPCRPPTATTPWGCTRLFELRHLVGDAVPAQVSGYAAPPIRSDMLHRDSDVSLRHRQSFGLARLTPSTLVVGGLREAGLLHDAVGPRLRPARPRRPGCHARVSGLGAWPRSAPAACGLRPRSLASCVPCHD